MSEPLTEATPEQVHVAWVRSVMYGHPGEATRERQLHSYDVPDPTYWRDDKGWGTARSITNPSAMYSMATWLKQRGFRVPLLVQAAWDETLRRQRERRKVEQVVDAALDHLHASDEPPTADDYAVAVIVAVREAFTARAGL